MIEQLFTQFVHNEGAAGLVDGATPWTNESAIEDVGRFFGLMLLPQVWEQAEEQGYSLAPEVFRAFGAVRLRAKQMVPVFFKGTLFLAASTPDVLEQADVASAMLNREVRPVLATSSVVESITNATLALGVQDSQQVFDELHHDVADETDLSIAVNELLDDTNEAPFIRAVNSILMQAVQAGASDIHVEPYREELRIRFRLDGVLYDRLKFPRVVHAPLVSRIKIMAHLDIAEKRMPQDGRIALVLGGREVDLRVSTLPTAFGERVVLRLLEKSGETRKLDQIGLGKDEVAAFRSFAALPNGIVLITGPTGSGKTTTLYALLHEMNAVSRNILTIEDPVEYQLDGVGQTQVDLKKGLTFANGLRTLLRQDPDVILIGEIRDKETAEIAVQAAMTGHLVLSTLHTNDAPGAVTRLLDMGIEPYLLASVLRGVVSQRLVRALCPHCSVEEKADETVCAELGVEVGTCMQAAVGCSECSETGYRGRFAIGEVMQVSEVVQKEILECSGAAALRKIAEEDGMSPLLHSGMQRVLARQTTAEEVLRVSRI